MKKIHLIMPMAGGGTRFGKRGFDLPKPLIEIQGKPFFYWAVKAVTHFVDVEDIVFVVLEDHIEKHSIDERIRSFFPNAVIHVIPHVLNGAVLTCCEGVGTLCDDLPILFNDCDHTFLSHQFYEFCSSEDMEKVDGALLTFKSDNPAYSYVEFDSEGRVIGTIEKKVVSDKAICGAYYFKNKDIFLSSVESYLSNCAYQEYFVSGVYNVMAAQQRHIVTFDVDTHISFGTPEEYETAKNDERLRNLFNE